MSGMDLAIILGAFEFVKRLNCSRSSYQSFNRIPVVLIKVYKSKLQLFPQPVCYIF